jgi:flagellar protein FliS
MPPNARGTYLENEILEVEGCRLIQLAYQAAIDAIGRAREHLRAGAIAARSREITRASELINELALGLDHSAGGELSRNLVELYDYIQRLLQQANFHQIEPPLIEAQNLLRTLAEAWQAAGSKPSPAPAPVNPAWELEPEHVPVDCVG